MLAWLNDRLGSNFTCLVRATMHVNDACLTRPCRVCLDLENPMGPLCVPDDARNYSECDAGTIKHHFLGEGEHLK